MRILIAGNWGSQIHEEPAAVALGSLSHEVHRFPWAQAFRGGGLLAQVSGRLQNKFLIGPRMADMNDALAAEVDRVRPELLLIFRGTHVLSETLRRVRARHPRLFIAGTMNDDPFGPAQPFPLWRHFLDAVPFYDLILAYRHSNIDEFRRVGAKDVRLLRSWFVPWVHRPISLEPEDRRRYEADVVFVGHHEDDGRVGMIEALLQDGHAVRLYGPDRGYGRFGWHSARKRSERLRRLPPPREVWGEEYVKVLRGARIALCFLSRFNRDTYTRRCFEIPAVGPLLLAERTDDLKGLFAEGREADYFSTAAELRAKVKLYLDDAGTREAVAREGSAKVSAAGHDVVTRMRDLIDYISARRGARE